MADTQRDVEKLLPGLGNGDEQAAKALVPLLYRDLRSVAERLFREEYRNHTLQPTALVHEAYLRLVKDPPEHWAGKTHFLAIAAEVMRRILVDHARSRLRKKRGGDRQRVSLHEGLALSRSNDFDVLAVHDALEKLAAIDPRQAKIVELRFFGGLSVAEVAQYLGVSKRTVESDWQLLRSWLRRELDQDGEP